MEEITIQEITGFHLGNAQDLEAATGCTVILCESGAVCGVDVRGGSPGTRDTDALHPVSNRTQTHAVVLSGGSSFGLDAAGGVMRFLEERGIGRDVGVTVVPNVCSAILFDLKCGRSDVRPDAVMGYEACRQAYEGRWAEGSVGAGTGATVGKARGRAFAMKGGLGTAAFRTGELMVGAVMAVNCVGDVADSRTGEILAGALADDGVSMADSQRVILETFHRDKDLFSGNTIIGCIVSNANLQKAQATKLAMLGHNGIARAVYPAHSVFDGDTMFAMCTGDVETNFDAAGILAAEAVRCAIINAVKQADSLGQRVSYRELLERRRENRA
ncbi:MAG: P1 family peptidase [Oscillospiraceae bacterium]